MPRGTMRAVYLGATTAAVLEAVPDTDAGFLVRSVIAWALRDELPEAVPPHLALAWKLIENESRTMHEARADDDEDLHKKRVDAGRKGGTATQSKAKQIKQTEANASKQANQAIETETEKEIENNPAIAGGASRPAPAPAREPWEPCEACPLEDELVRSEARRCGMGEDELARWRDYWTMRDWRSDPRSARPMTRAGVKASIRKWHADEGIRAAREAHLDAKADERAAKRTAELAAANRPPLPESISIDEQDERAERLRAAHPEDFARV